MAFDAHANFAFTAVAVAPITPTAGTALTVTTGAGALFPAAPFNVVIWPTSAQPSSTNAEIARCTNVVGDVLTIVRAQEGTSARTVVVGDQIMLAPTTKVFTDIEAATPSALVTAKGDLIVATASGVVTRHGIGSDGRGLLADSGQSNGLVWAQIGMPLAVPTSSSDFVTIPIAVPGAGTASFTDSVERCYPFELKTRRTLSVMAVRTQSTAASAGGVYRFGIRNPDGTLVADAGTVAVTSVNSNAQVAPAASLGPGVYLATVTPQGAPTTAAIIATVIGSLMIPTVPADTLTNGFSTTRYGGYSIASVSGALPSSPTLVKLQCGSSGTNHPMIVLGF